MIGTPPLGRSALGPTIPHRAGAIDTVLPATGTLPQEAHRLGSPDDPATAPLLPNRSLVIVGDNGYAVLDLLHCCQSLREPVTLITRLRLDAGLYDPAPPLQPGQSGRSRVKGSRRPTLKELLHVPDLPWLTASVSWYDGTIRTLELASQTAVWYHHGKPPVPIRWVLIRDPQGELDTQALLCTDQTVAPTQTLEWFVLRWQLEVTYQEARAHLGVETQRQWSDQAIARTTAILMGLFSWVARAAHSLQQDHPITQRTAAWYIKPAPTFVNAIALVRRHLWMASHSFSTSVPDSRLCTKARIIMRTG